MRPATSGHFDIIFPAGRAQPTLSLLSGNLCPITTSMLAALSPANTTRQLLPRLNFSFGCTQPSSRLSAYVPSPHSVEEQLHGMVPQRNVARQKKQAFFQQRESSRELSAFAGSTKVRTIFCLLNNVVNIRQKQSAKELSTFFLGPPK